MALMTVLAAGLLTSCGGASTSTEASAASTPSVVAPSLADASATAATSPSTLPDDAAVTYAFHDSSVPPPYHRSVTLTLDRDSARIVVDSYGDVLADETTATTAQAWAELGATLASMIDLKVEPGPDGCTGGTSIDLVVTSGSTPIVDVSPEFCAGSNEGLDTAIDSWIAPARELFPATDVLAPTLEPPARLVGWVPWRSVTSPSR
jgi:hypothetical protein